MLATAPKNLFSAGSMRLFSALHDPHNAPGIRHGCPLAGLASQVGNHIFDDIFLLIITFNFAPDFLDLVPDLKANDGKIGFKDVRYFRLEIDRDRRQRRLCRSATGMVCVMMLKVCRQRIRANSSSRKRRSSHRVVAQIFQTIADFGSAALQLANQIANVRQLAECLGLPRLCYFDNGKTYDSYALNGRSKWQRRQSRLSLDATHTGGILKNLGCKARFCWAYHGQSKPIERWFGTLETQFGRTWPTYCGNSTANKPEGLQLQIDRGSAPTLADFTEALNAYIATVYNVSPHTGDAMDGRSPAQIHAASWNGTSKRTALPEFVDELLKKQTQPVKVTKNGVRWNHLRYGQNEPALYMEYLGKEVYLRIDERDVSRVHVWSLDDKFICVARSNDRIAANATEQDLREAIAAKKSHRRVINDYYRQRPRLHQDIPDLMIEAAAKHAAERRRDEPTPTPPNISPIRSPLEDELPKLARALKADLTISAAASKPKMFDMQAYAEELEFADAPRPARTNWLGINDEEPEQRLPSFAETMRPLTDRMERERQEEDAKQEEQEESDRNCFRNLKPDGTHG